MTFVGQTVIVNGAKVSYTDSSFNSLLTSTLFSLTIIPFGSKPTAPDWMKVSHFINEKHKFLAKLFENKEIFDG